MSGREGEGFESGIVFKLLATALQTQGAEVVKRFNGVYAVKLTGGRDGKVATWVIDLKSGKGKVEFEGKTKPDVIMEFADADFVDLLTGKLNAQKAFFQGKMKIKGNMGMAMKLQEFQNKIKNVNLSKL